MIRSLFVIFLIIFIGCDNTTTEEVVLPSPDLDIKPLKVPSLVILGTIQDAGSPQIGCQKSCCERLFAAPDPGRKVVSLGLVDPDNDKAFLIEASPDLSSQLQILNELSPRKTVLPDGILLTHAHVGHYTGLMYLGKEAFNASGIPIYTMPRMQNYLEDNGPWSQLVSDNNIRLISIRDREKIKLSDNFTITPILVPHRDEFSETVGFHIQGREKKVLFIPDIDKWEKWDSSIVQALAEVDFAFLDATFFDSEELNNRDMTTIPHPFIVESMNTFDSLPHSERSKIYFIHFNHTNPVLNKESKAYQQLIEKGYNIAEIRTVLTI